MTNREFYNTIINTNDDLDLVEKAKELLRVIDTKNGKRAETEKAKREKENAPILESIRSLAETKKDVLVASEIAEQCGISISKASAMCRQLVNSGYFSVEDYKVKGKGTVKGYRLA